MKQKNCLMLQMYQSANDITVKQIHLYNERNYFLLIHLFNLANSVSQTLNCVHSSKL